MYQWHKNKAGEVKTSVRDESVESADVTPEVVEAKAEPVAVVETQPAAAEVTPVAAPETAPAVEAAQAQPAAVVEAVPE